MVSLSASLAVTKEIVERYKANMREIDARPTKKVAEAKVRKKRRVSSVFFKMTLISLRR